MILHLRLNKMDLQPCEHPLSVCQRQPDHLRRIFCHRCPAANTPTFWTVSAPNLPELPGCDGGNQEPKQWFTLANLLLAF
jgi:hypothetical protein